MIFGNIILYKKREEGRFYVSLINLVLQSNVFTLNDQFKHSDGSSSGLH